VCAALAATSAVLHALMIGDAGSAVVAVLIAGMAAACLYCARELWTGGSPRVWVVVAVMNLGMVAVHWSMPGHHHGQAVVAGATPMSTSMSTLMAVATSISLAEAAIATVVLWRQTRSRASSFSLAARSRGAI
jgi:hypothetical protein